MSPDDTVVIEVFGEGKTDVGHDPSPHPPSRGVIPILLNALCDRPSRMLVKRHGRPFMMRRGTLRQKVRFAKRQARITGSAGAVFVVDSDGDMKRKKQELVRGRNMEPGDFPLALGVAHPCIESWLLADAAAIRRGLELNGNPSVPEEPESLPATWRDRKNDPKAALDRAAGPGKKLSAREKDKIARAVNDLDLLERRCPLGFAPFADEVRQRVRPLFNTQADSES